MIELAVIPREQFHRMNIMLYGVYSEIEELSVMFRVVVYGCLIYLCMLIYCLPE